MLQYAGQRSQEASEDHGPAHLKDLFRHSRCLKEDSAESKEELTDFEVVD